MDKYGVNKEILYQDLRNEEGRLMMEMQECMTLNKTASEKNSVSNKLQAVRNKITELDLGRSNVE